MYLLTRRYNYQNAGTITFLVDKHRYYSFREMNTRIQVEHGVTDEITGIGLVKWLLLIAAGEKSPIDPKDVKISKHAIEYRINADDPLINFAACPGEIVLYYSPGGHGICVDSHVDSRYIIPQLYDSTVAKLIASG
jgi:acetyl-CoA carboxylase biotin carboxylase subunit